MREWTAPRAALLSTMFGSLRASYRLSVKGAPDSRLLELRDVTASIVPAAPSRSVVNAVVYERPETLEAMLDDVAQAYEEAGVRAWTIWVPDGDEQAIEFLESAGHELDLLDHGRDQRHRGRRQRRELRGRGPEHRANATVQQAGRRRFTRGGRARR
jgi:hypothetical protein